MPIIADPRLTLEQKRAAIQRMGYNQQVAAITRLSRHTLSLLLDEKSLTALSAWMARRWQTEQAAHGIASFSPPRAERSYKIFATRHDSGGRYAVALPDKCLKFSNAGNHVCDSDGYQVNQGYMVILSYDGSTGAEVWESGPWNVDDNYWSGLADPQPRRMFADLPLGMPEAQAAYFDGYNGGVDQFGRTVSAPFGIDLARQVSIDIGLQPGNNDWITVSYMWTDGWGKKPKGGQEQGATSAPVTPLPPAVQTSTPNPDGSIVHEVQPGQALWSIAAIYEVTLQEIYQLNNLNESSVTLNFARRSRLERDAGMGLAAGVVGACTIEVARVVAVTFFINQAAGWALLPMAAIPFAAGVLLTAWAFRPGTPEGDPATVPIDPPANPLRLGSAIRLALLFHGAMMALTWVRGEFGDPGVLPLAALLGLTGVDALTVSMARLGTGEGTVRLAAQAILVGVLSNTLRKFAVAVTLAISQFRRPAGAGLAYLAAAGLARVAAVLSARPCTKGGTR